MFRQGIALSGAALRRVAGPRGGAALRATAVMSDCTKRIGRMMDHTHAGAAPRPFTHTVPKGDITDLYRRLHATRWPDEVNDGAWGWGVPVADMRALCVYWQEKFDWRAAEARLFAHPHFLIDLDGLDLHFIHARSPHENATPLIMTHGWPGSVFEFLSVIPRLTEPEKFGGNAADAFHVVAPSLQGYGFSPAAKEPGMSQKRVAQRHARLMAALGYGRYIAQGGDWGSLVAQHTANLDPAHCIGLHINMVQPIPPADVADPMTLVQPHEMRYLANAQNYRDTGSGYFHQQRSKPQTLAYGLTDSPAGWCAWVAEKFHAWTDCQGDIRNAVSWDDLLANISFYWFTGTIASSSRFYREFHLAQARGDEPLFPVTVPTGIAQYPFDILGSPRAWAERAYPVMHWYEAPRGGHFAALEQPDLFARDLWAFNEKIGRVI
jgi:pimeloyl-ACP methyl ester carboxylesterase